MPWGGRRGRVNEPNVGGYHLVWSRDLYQVATAFHALGDKESADRALNYLFTRPAEAGRQLPAKLLARRPPLLGFAPVRRGRLPAHPRLPTRAHRQRDLRQARPPRRQLHRPPRPVDAAGALGRGVGLLAFDHRRRDRRARLRGRDRAPQQRQRFARHLARRGRRVGAQRRAWTATTTGQHGDGNYYLRLTKRRHARRRLAARAQQRRRHLRRARDS